MRQKTIRSVPFGGVAWILAAFFCGCVSREPVDKTWAWEIGLKARNVERALGAPFDLPEGRRSWSWRMELVWDGDFPVSAALRLADLETVADRGSTRILHVDVGRSPAPLTVHVIPVDEAIPEAEEVVFVVVSRDDVFAVALANPFRGVTGGDLMPGGTSIDDPRATTDRSGHLQLIRVCSLNLLPTWERTLYLEVTEG